MALEFRKRLFRKPSKKAQYILAFLALFLVLTLVICWGIVRHRLGEREIGDSSSAGSTVAENDYTNADKGHLLVIVADSEKARFIYLQSDPANNTIYAMTVPSTLTIKDGMSTEALYRKHGTADTAAALGAALDLPLSHHLSLTAANAEKWCTALENGLDFTMPQAVNLKTASDTPLSLTSGKQTLTAAQTVALLLHADTFADDVIATIINQYMREGRYLLKDFERLSNLAQTDLRIGDFTEYRHILDYLAFNNQGALCCVIDLPTITKNDTTVVDLAKLKKSSALYQ